MATSPTSSLSSWPMISTPGLPKTLTWPVLVPTATSLNSGSQPIQAGLWGKPYVMFFEKLNNSFCNFNLSAVGPWPRPQINFNIFPALGFELLSANKEICLVQQYTALL